ncbi:MAG: cupin domain-containing protein [Chloroflexi bacterium]|nr:cupin domain-containing protein [Chloroflexota bacterium]
MVEKVTQRAREPEPQENIYEYLFAWHNQKARNMREGKVVIHGRDLTWEQGRQALLKFYLTPKVWNQVGTPGWFLFINRIIRQSGKHRHQGGLGIYVLEGKGYTVVDGVKYDWEKDDLILLPVKDGGCEHQHFNTDPNKPSEWLAFIYDPFRDATGCDIEQKEVSPDYKGPAQPTQMPHVA